MGLGSQRSSVLLVSRELRMLPDATVMLQNLSEDEITITVPFRKISSRPPNNSDHATKAPSEWT